MLAPQLYQLLWTLLSIPAPSAYLVQNPPSIPALAAVWLAARLRSARLVIDWHNFGYTVLATSMGVGQSHPVVVLAYWYEYFFGRCGDGHFCVTAAMADWLRHTWGIHATVLYDRAPEAFKPPSAAAVHALLRDMRPPLPKVCKEVGPDATPLTHLDEGGQAVWSPHRPALLMSSTSWTPDEDFGILLEALCLYDAAAAGQEGAAEGGDTLPPLLVLVTGKGPQREAYLRRIGELDLRHVAVTTAWLEAGQYPTAVGAADLGVCLHTSTSGLDLPMKVVDMFGAGVPAAAVSFPCLPELVKHGSNGVVFRDAHQLAGQLQQILAGFPWEEEGYSAYREAQAAGGGEAEEVKSSAPLLLRLRQGVAAQRAVRWADNWNRVAAPVFAQ